MYSIIYMAYPTILYFDITLYLIAIVKQQKCRVAMV